LGEPVRGTAAAAGEPVDGVRIGVVRDFNGATADAAVEASFARTLARLQAAGAVLVDPVRASLPPAVVEAEFTLLVAEFRGDLDRYLRGVERGVRSLDELAAFNSARAADVMPHFGQEILLAARDSGGTTAEGYAAALETTADARSALASVFSEHDLVALVAPTNSRAWRTDYAAGDASGGVYTANIAAVTGYPSITVPAELAGELPLGVSFIGRPGAESRLVSIAAAVERQRGPFPAPRFLPSVPD
jgi:amidase